MLSNDQDGIVDDQSNDVKPDDLSNNDDQSGNQDDTKVEKPKRTPEEQLAYHDGRAKRLRKDLGLEEEVKSEPKKETKKSNGLDFGAKAYLLAKGIQDSKEIKFVESAMKESGMDLEVLLDNKYFNSQLEEFRAINKTADATPSNNTRSGGPQIDSVEYWAAKPFEEVPKELRRKVLNFQLQKEENTGHFYNS